MIQVNGGPHQKEQHVNVVFGCFPCHHSRLGYQDPSSEKWFRKDEEYKTMVLVCMESSS